MKQILLAIVVAAAAMAQQPDNTAVNKRDRNDSTMTAEKQGNSKADTELVAKVRRAITRDEAFSTTAKNIKIVANNGQVWLRGPVPTEAEKERLVAIARSIAGDQRVTSHLEVTKGDQ